MFEEFKLLFKRITSSKFVLKGKCKKCGSCCKNIVFFIEEKPIQTEEQFDILKEWNKSYHHFFISGKDDDGALLFTCKSLDENNICKNYFFRSIKCRTYPYIKKDFILNGGRPLDGCGYYFSVDKNFASYLKQEKELG